MGIQQLFIKITEPDGMYKYVTFSESDTISIHAESGQQFHVTAFLNGEEIELTEALALVQSGDDLIITVEGGSQVTLLDYAAVEDTSISLINDTGELVVLSTAEDTDAVVQLDNGDYLL